MLRCLKNNNGVIIAMGNDEGQSGLDVRTNGIWCDWTVETNALPAFSAIEGANPRAMRYKENEAQDGIELRSEAEVLESPNG